MADPLHRPAGWAEILAAADLFPPPPGKTGG